MENNVNKSQDVEQLVDKIGDSARDLTIGEQRIGIQFKKGNNDDKQNLQEHFAHMINLVHKLSNDKNGRQISVAMTQIEDASMWAVKSLFTK